MTTAPAPRPRPRLAPRKPVTSIAELSAVEQLKIRVCFHEAGHAVMATLLGGEVSTAAVGQTRIAGILGTTTYRHHPESARPAIAFAGVWAEGRWIDGKRPSRARLDKLFAGTGHHDARELALSGGRAGLSSEVGALLERCWPSVVKVAQSLWRDGEVTHDTICAALGIPTTDARHHHLAVIRAGSAPGSFSVSSPG